MSSSTEILSRDLSSARLETNDLSNDFFVANMPYDLPLRAGPGPNNQFTMHNPSYRKSGRGRGPVATFMIVSYNDE